MNWDGWFTLGLLILMIYGLTRYAYLADVIMLGGVTLLGAAGIVTPQEAFAGFSNPGMLTVAALFVVAAAMRDTGSLDGVARSVLDQPKGERRTLMRLCPPIALMSAFLNNTTIVAMAMPVVLDWCRKHRLSASRFLIPLSYATIAGGVCTLIGTSTNLVVHGLMIESNLGGLSFFEIGWVGLPIAVVTMGYLVIVSPRWLPHRRELLEQLGDTRREYMVEMRVEPGCPLIGLGVQEAGLRQLPGLFLVEIRRADEIVSPVSPDEKLCAEDRLVFVGVVSTIIDLQKTKGLVPVSADDAADWSHVQQGRHLCEAVVSSSSPYVGRGVREANFRTVYDAAIIAVHRNGERLPGKIGDIVLRAGDTLLLSAGAGFVRAHRNNPDFFLVSEVGEAVVVRHEKSATALVILMVLVVCMALPDVLEWIGVSHEIGSRLDRARVLSAMAAAGLMVVTRCVPSASARRSVQWDVLLVIAASFGISTAMSKSGLAQFLASGFLPALSPMGPVAGLAAIYLIGLILTELLTNNAAAALTFPLAIATAANFNADPRPFCIAVAVSASGGFCTPFGYQAHLMIFGPGGYRFTDFVKMGWLLNLLWMLVTVMLVPLYWPLAAR